MSNFEHEDSDYIPDLLTEEEMDEALSKMLSHLDILNEDKNLSSFKSLPRIKRFSGLDKERDRLFSFPLSNYKFFSQFSLPKAERKFDATTFKFNKELLNVVNDLRNKQLTLADAKIQSAKIISNTFSQSFSQGGSAVANNLKFHKKFVSELPEEPLKPSDKKWISSASSEELKYFHNLLDDIDSGAIYGKKYSAEERVAMYAKTLKSQFEAGKVANAPFYSLIKWKINPALETCPGCIFMSSKSFWTKETLPTTPRAGATSCRYNCGCKLEVVPVTKETYGKFKKTAITKVAAESMLKFLFK